MHRLNSLALNYIRYDGYGRFATHVVLALAGLGVDVKPLCHADYTLPPTLQYLRGMDHTRLTLAIMPPTSLPKVHGRVWLYTMTEGYEINPEWVEICNSVERLLVPSPWLVDVFQKAGVEVPIHVVPGGIAPHEFPIQPPLASHRPYTFLAFGDRGSRKGWDRVNRAYALAFCETTPDEFAAHWRENKHTLEPLQPVWRADTQILVKVMPANLHEFYMGNWSYLKTLVGVANSMAEVYALADCVVVPSKGEGWGFFAREAAAMGRPVIVGNWTGHAPDAEQWATVALNKSTLVRTPMDDLGWWHHADTDELAQAMAWCYDHPVEAIEKARAGAEWLHANQTWRHTAQALVDLMETYH